MTSFISSLINYLLTIVLSLVVANYGFEKFHHFIKKEAIAAASGGLPSLSKMTNQLTCKQFNASMELVPYSKGNCVKEGKEK